MILDLCSGIGRWPTSEEVVRIDIDRKTKPTIIADVRALPLRAALKPRLLHASPPCKYFSRARKWNPKGVAESLRIVAAVFDEIDRLQPGHWCIENPTGRLARILHPDVKTEYSAEPGRSHGKYTSFWSDMRSLRRAIIPANVRQQILASSQERIC